MTAPLRHLVRKAEPGAPLLLLLHGFGSNEEDLFSLEPAFDERFTVVSARAPLTLERGAYAWFPLAFSDQGPVVLDPQQAESSREDIAAFIRWSAAELKTDQARTVLVGFSQGAILASGVALTEPGLVRAAVLHSGRILPEIPARAKTADEPPRFLVVHGTYDPVLPVAHGRAARDALTALGLKTEYREYPMAHQISDESLDLVTSWTKLQAGLAD